MDKNHYKIDSTSSFKFDENYDSDIFLKIRIKMCHDNLNKNSSDILFEAMEDAESSLKNTPILGNMIKKEDGDEDFNSHDIDVNVEKTDEGYEVNYIYVEKIIGIIPETNNYEVIEEDGKNYVYVDGYIYKGYSNGADDIFVRDGEKKVSMEIIVDESEIRDDGVIEIQKYRYTGLTILGDHIETGMYDTNAVVVKYENTNKVYEKMLQELNKELLEKKGDLKHMSKKEQTKKMFELSFDDIRALLFEALNPLDNEGYREWNYWIMETFENYCVVQDEKNSNDYYKVFYEKNEDGESITVGEMEKIYVQYLTESEKSALEEMRSNYAKLVEEAKAKVDTEGLESDTNEEDISKQKEFEKEKAKLISDMEELRDEFSKVSEKLEKFESKEKAEAIDSLISEFVELNVFSEKELEDYREKFSSLEELEKQLTYALGVKNRESQKKFSSEDANTEEDNATKVVKHNFEENDDDKEATQEDFPFSEDLKKTFEKVKNNNK